MGISIAITSGKGGVGKSTAAVGLSRALAQRRRRVLLIDCDAGLRSLDRMTGIEHKLVYDVGDLIRGHCVPADAIYACTPSLYVLPAPSNIQDAVPPPVMKKLIPFLKKYYDYVILDSPAGVGNGFRSAVCAADRALIVCNPDCVCVRGTSTAQRLLQREGISQQDLLINRLNTKFFDTVNIYRDLDAVIDESGVQLLGVIPEDFEFAASFLRGEAADEMSPGNMAFTRIAGRIEGDTIPLGI